MLAAERNAAPKQNGKTDEPDIAPSYAQTGCYLPVMNARAPRFLNVTSMFFLFTIALVGCGARPSGPEPEDAEACRSCLASGGTWQVGECTRDCALQDVSCYRDACPGPCGGESCGTCEGAEACEGAGCTWNVAGEAMWCTAAPRSAER